ncbi:hypothetical protein V1524DRAFT_298615 [Lipomyces starkeyi]
MILVLFHHPTTDLDGGHSFHSLMTYMSVIPSYIYSVTSYNYFHSSPYPLCPIFHFLHYIHYVLSYWPLLSIYPF